MLGCLTRYSAVAGYRGGGGIHALNAIVTCSRFHTASFSFNKAETAETGAESVSAPSESTPVKPRTGHDRPPIVVAVDTSNESLQAMKWTIENLRPGVDRRMYILHVLPDMFASPAAGPAYFGDSADPLVEDALWREAKTYLEDVFVAEARRMGVTVEPVLVKESEHKHVGSALVKKAEELEACPLVLAKHTKPNWQQLLLGSTSKFCALNCHAPVLLLHPGYF